MADPLASAREQFDIPAGVAYLTDFMARYFYNHPSSVPWFRRR